MGILALGCDRDLGECNLDGMTANGTPLDGPAALDLAFRVSDGVPMYEGQALVQSSCGGATGFCHSEVAERGDRFGVAFGLNFNLRLACTDPTDNPNCADIQPCPNDSFYCQQLERLTDNQSHMRDWAEEAISDIRRGTMPPGAAGRAVQDNQPWLRADGTPLPDFGTSEATEIVRNWLACASPIVERTEFPPSPQQALMPCANSLEGETCIYSGSEGVLPDPMWSSIYFTLIFESCLTCHAPLNGNTDQNPNNPLGGTIPGGASSEGLAALDLSGSDPMDTTNWASESWSAVVDAPASDNGDCGGQGFVVVVPNDAPGSLMVQKLRAVQTCGDEMPPALGEQTISDPVVAIVEEWIALGAPND